MVDALKNWFLLAAIALPSGWLLERAFGQYRLNSDAPRYERVALEHLAPYAEALYSKGFSAYLEGSRGLALDCFRAAVKTDPFQIDAWLRIAENSSADNAEHARRILEFTARIADGVQTWRWQQALLARELGIESFFLEQCNALLRLPFKRSDTFQLLDAHFNGNPLRLLDPLDKANRVPFLQWLMRWDRFPDALLVWNLLAADGMLDRVVSEDFVHYLLGHKEADKAAAIWASIRGDGGMTNGGFEDELQSRGFDWRVTKSDTGKWRSQRVRSPVHGGAYALEVVFKGNENLDFMHLGQIVHLQPGRLHRLRYARHYRGITSDQGPFIEIIGYDCQGLHAQGPMMLGASGWTVETLVFDPPPDCHSAIVRLRRVPSRRFDNLLAGTVWLDDFALENSAD
jgi:hypothetical protein